MCVKRHKWGGTIHEGQFKKVHRQFEKYENESILFIALLLFHCERFFFGGGVRCVS